MTIAIRDDLIYIFLRTINQSATPAVHFKSSEFVGRRLTVQDFLGHLDYLNQKGYIDAEFTGNAYALQDDVPSLLEVEEANYRIPDVLGAPDGPLPHLITFKQATLTEKGEKMLADMEANPPAAMETGPRTPIATKDMPFLEKVQLRGELPDIYDARSITEVVFRAMRDMMPKDMIQEVKAELHEPAADSEKKVLQVEVADLWMDQNPIVRFLSQIRPPFQQGHGLLEVDGDRFKDRIRLEAGLPGTTDSDRVLKAVFSATKEELPKDKIEAISQWLPGHIRELWKAV